SLLKITPAHLAALDHMLDDHDRMSRAVRRLVVGGEALHGRSLRFWRDHARDVRVVNEYGPTETVVGCCVYDVPAGAVDDGALPIGGPIANTRAYLLDDALAHVPIGVAAELCIG